MAENPFPRVIPNEYYLTARKILVLPTVEQRLEKIGRKIQRRAGKGHAIKTDLTRDRVRVQVYTETNSAKAAEASGKNLTRAFAAERTTPRRPAQ